LKNHDVNFYWDLEKDIGWVFKYIEWRKFQLDYFQNCFGPVPFLKKAAYNYDLKYFQKFLKIKFTLINNFKRFLKPLPINEQARESLLNFQAFFRAG
jgi:hypothetical protein